MIKIKRFICAFLCFSLIFSTVGIAAFASDGEEDEYFSDEQLEYYASLGLQGTTLNVYNWGEYISDGS